MTSKRKQAGLFVALTFAVVFAFTTIYVTAFNDPHPREVKVAVVGGPWALRTARGALDPKLFYAVPYPSQAAARDALDHDDIRGIVALGPGGATVTVASAYSPPETQATRDALTAVAHQAGP